MYRQKKGVLFPTVYVLKQSFHRMVFESGRFNEFSSDQCFGASKALEYCVAISSNSNIVSSCHEADRSPCQQLDVIIVHPDSGLIGGVSESARTSATNPCRLTLASSDNERGRLVRARRPGPGKPLVYYCDYSIPIFSKDTCHSKSGDSSGELSNPVLQFSLLFPFARRLNTRSKGFAVTVHHGLKIGDDSA